MYNWHIISGIILVIMMSTVNLNFVYGDTISTTKNKIKTLELSNLNENENFLIDYPDIAQIMSNKHSFLLNNKNYTVYDILINLDTSIYDHEGKVSAMSVDPTKNSMEINFDNILQDDSIELRFNSELIPSQNENFMLLIDGTERGYSLTTQKNDIIINFVIPKGTQQVELVGSKIIPEFGPITGLIIAISIISVIMISTRFRFIHKI